jgi:DNA repair photolyase
MCMSLRIYTGEYLISPALLHFGGNWCTHGCAYCFANLNKPDRVSEPNDIARVLKWFDTGSTAMEYELLRMGHPILMSNDSDPCAKSNAAIHRCIVEALSPLGVRFAYQTRGGVPEEEQRIIDQPPTMVYVSLTTDDERVRQRHEPGAPPHAQRMDFIRRLRQAGHMVVVGLNPFVPKWWGDVDACFEQLASWGVAHVWHQAMHLSRWQISAMTDKAKVKHADLIDYASKKVAPDAKDYAAAMDRIEAMGFNLFSGGVSNKLGFWDEWFDRLGYPWSPTLDALVRDCDLAAGGQPLAIDLAEFNEWADIGLTRPRAIWKEFLNGFGRSVRNTGEDTRAHTQAEANAFIWRFDEFPTRFRHACFARVLYDDAHAADLDGVPLMAVSKDGFAEWEVGHSDVTFLNHPLERKCDGREPLCSTEEQRQVQHAQGPDGPQAQRPVLAEVPRHLVESGAADVAPPQA